MTHIAVLLFDRCDAMDVVGPYEVFLTASRLAERDGASPPFVVVTTSPDGHPVTAYGGLGLVPSHGALADIRPDVLVVPGLIDLDAALADTALIEAIGAASVRADVTASVCTGAFLLDAAGVLADHAATTHWEDAPLLQQRRNASAPVHDDVRWVDSGSVVTSGGLSSGIAMALHLVERFATRDLAGRTARQLDYRWTSRREGGGSIS